MTTSADTSARTDTPTDDIPASSRRPADPFARLPLRRSARTRMLGGVCAGIADYLSVDVTLVRVAFAVLTLLGGAGIPAYLAGLLLIPEEGTDQSIAGSLLNGL
jgi:phage shock protein PspC (stress-responsive transcriptional regulator)